jgi:phage repressor protein C with HTH and peptisase S24 domain
MDTQKDADASFPSIKKDASDYDRDLGDRIRVCRGLMSRAMLATKLGVHINTVAKLERGDTSPDASQIQQISKVGNRSIEWLVTGREQDESSLVNETSAVTSGRFVYVPHFDVLASAGAGNVFEKIELVLAMRPFDDGYIRNQLGISHNQLALINVIGNSMEPLLRSNDTVLLDMRSNDIPNEGMHVIRLDGALLVKQLQFLPGKILRVSSANQDYMPFDIKADEDSDRDFSIIGRVRWCGVTIS